ncbi:MULTISPECIES: hypothetical protein [Brucella]|uniref:Uncharacterized protein n=1 Tax=Brucella inopinata TaxID=1218315 RepID=A0AAW7B927_9HYPH|nr:MULTISPECIES: hypothetical protein [Brucella]APX69020.1 hypothetical protein BKD03_06030 [Brucella sp. 09RB8471]MDL2333245.1 hypothetical protein [Brucella inopinata]
MTAVLQMTKHNRAEFVLGMAEAIPHLIKQTQGIHAIPDHEIKSTGKNLYKRARQLREINIAKSASLLLMSLYMEALTTPGDDASLAVTMCETIFEDLIEEASSILEHLQQSS